MFYNLLHVLFILVVLIMLPVILISDEGLDGKIFFIIWSIVVICMLFSYLKMPKKIEYDQISQKIAFQSFFNKKEIEASSVLKVKTTFLNNAFITFYHKSGKFILVNSIDGLHELINEIKIANPNLETRGC